MKQENLHPIQVKILRVLLFKPEAKFTELNSDRITTDHFNFHVKRLLEIKLIEKIEGKLYSLTKQGKEYANRYDTDVNEIERQAKVTVRIGSYRQANGKMEYLMQERLKQPYFGYLGFVGGKIKWGETLNECCLREFEEETGMTAEFELKAIRHKMDYDEDGNLLEDKFFFIFLAKNLKGEMFEKFEGGRNVWMTKEEVEGFDKLYDGVIENIDSLHNKEISMWENRFNVKGY